MMQLEIGGRRYPVPAGEITVGSDPGCGIVVEGTDVRPRHAVVEGLPDGTVAVRRADADADVQVNGIRLGDEPTPVLHGDTIHVAGHELLVADARRGGRTQLFDASGLAATPVAARSSGGWSSGGSARVKAPAANGRVVSLTDGREYAVGHLPLVFGRDAASDVVVPGEEVSRRHAEIRETADGYLLVDTSANGTSVNGERIGGVRRLTPGDMIRIGADDFRFHADPAPGAEPPAGPPPGAEEQLKDTMVGIAFPRPSDPARAAAPLASLLLRSGSRKGERLAVRSAVVRIGRAEFNDVVIDDASLGEAHATLQRRDAVWILTDLGSPAGTTVDGEPVGEEYPLSPGATIRFGDVAVLFEPLDDPAADRGDERADADSRFVGRDDAAADAMARADERPRPRRPIQRRTSEPRAALSTWWVGTAVVAAAVIAYLLLS